MCILSGSDNVVGPELLSQISGLFNEKNEEAKIKLLAEVLIFYFLFYFFNYLFIDIFIDRKMHC